MTILKAPTVSNNDRVRRAPSQRRYFLETRNELVAVPPGVVTVSGPFPIGVPAGTDVTIVLPLFEVTTAVIPLNWTVAPVKLEPEIVTDVPT